MPSSDAYRLALLDAYTQATPAAQQALTDELAHQRDVEKLFLRVEIATVAVASSLLIGVFGLATYLILTGASGWGSATLLADIVAAVVSLLGRSYFIGARTEAAATVEST